MAAMKPRTGDGPLEVTKEGRGIVMRVPLEGGGRLVVEISADEASALGDALKAVVKYRVVSRAAFVGPPGLPSRHPGGPLYRDSSGARGLSRPAPGDTGPPSARRSRSRRTR